MSTGDDCDELNVGHLFFVIFIVTLSLAGLFCCYVLMCRPKRVRRHVVRYYRRLPGRGSAVHQVPPMQQQIPQQQWHGPSGAPPTSGNVQQGSAPSAYPTFPGMVPNSTNSRSYGTMRNDPIYPNAFAPNQQVEREGDAIANRATAS